MTKKWALLPERKVKYILVHLNIAGKGVVINLPSKSKVVVVKHLEKSYFSKLFEILSIKYLCM